MSDVGSGAPGAHPDWPAPVCPKWASLQQTQIFQLAALRLFTSSAIHAPPPLPESLFP
jgi:hypothetical protein